MATKVSSQTTKTAPRKTAARPANGSAKRPATRRVQAAPSRIQTLLQENVQWLFLGAGAVIVGVLLFLAYNTATASAVFNLKKTDIDGTKHTPNSEIEKIVQKQTAKNGVWHADLSQTQKEIERISWVKAAVVSRVLPDQMRVRIVERAPKAVVRKDDGAKIWVDDEARELGAVGTNEKDLPFVLEGWKETKDGAANKINLDFVRDYQKLLEEWRKIGVANRVTAINLADADNVEVHISQNGAVIPAQLGNQNVSGRLLSTLAELDKIAANGNINLIEKVVAYNDAPIISFRGATPATIEPKTNVKIAKNQKKAVR